MLTNTHIYYFYNNECIELTKKILELSKKYQNTKFYFLNLSLLDNEDSHAEEQTILNENLSKFDPTSYPQFFIVRDSICIETIFGTYKNILNILKCYI